MSEPLPFEMQPNESPQAFAAFVIYRDMHADRSLEHVSQKHKKSIATLGKWSTRHNWVQRARSYDAAMDARARIATEQEAIQQRRQMLQQHADEARSLRQVARRILDEFERRFGEKGTLQWIGGDDFIKVLAQLPKIVETAQKLERLAVGEPSDNLEPPKPFDLMTDDELTEYIELLRASIS